MTNPRLLSISVKDIPKGEPPKNWRAITLAERSMKLAGVDGEGIWSREMFVQRAIEFLARKPNDNIKLLEGEFLYSLGLEAKACSLSI